MKEYAELLHSLDVSTCDALRRALELGKWPDGSRLSKQQKELCMQAVIAFDHNNCAVDRRVGYIDLGAKSKPKSDSGDTELLAWRDDFSTDQSKGDAE